jgi:hypothetical protein
MSTVNKRLTALEQQANPTAKGPYIVVYTHDTDSPDEQQRSLDEAHVKAGPTGTVIHVQYESTPLPGQV